MSKNENLKEYEFINPSDPYTFLAKNFEIATLTVFVIGTQYGAKSKDGSEEVPVFFLGGSDEWYQEQFGRTVEEGINTYKKEIAEALASFMLGDFEDRKRYDAALNAITDPDKKKEFIEVWQDGRSSINDIGTYAHKIAEKLFGTMRDATPEEQKSVEEHIDKISKPTEFNFFDE